MLPDWLELTDDKSQEFFFDEQKLLKQDVPSLVEDVFGLSEQLHADAVSYKKMLNLYHKIKKENEELKFQNNQLESSISKYLILLAKKGSVRDTAGGILLRKNGASMTAGSGTIKKTWSMPLPEFVDQAGVAAETGITEKPQPDFIRWQVRKGTRTTFLMEFPPIIRSMNVAIEGYGTNAKYKIRRLATPWVVMKISFNGNQVDTYSGEVYYRNSRMETVDDKLCWCNLFNISVWPGSSTMTGRRSWMCTQYLHQERHDGTIYSQLTAIQHHLWGAGFNRSSEHHEGESGFSLYEKKHTDKRTKDIKAWEKATAKDDWEQFVTGMDWIPVPKVGSEKQMTVRDLLADPNTPKNPEDKIFSSMKQILLSQGTKGLNE